MTMPWPLIRVDLDERSRDFFRTALQPGFPVLDRFAANNSVMRSWLGRFAAEVQWDDQAVRYLWRDDDDQTAPTAVQPLTAADVRGPLKAEVEALKTRLKQAAPKSPNDRALHTLMQQRLDRILATNPTESGALYKVRVRGKWKLVWCWGYDRRHSEIMPLKVCRGDTCRLAYFDSPDLRGTCPRCGIKNRSGGFVQLLALAAILLILLGGGYFAWNAAGLPSLPLVPEIAAVIVDAQNDKPIREAAIRLVDSRDVKATSGKDGAFRFQGSRSAKYEIRALGYTPLIWTPSSAKPADGPERIRMAGEAEVSGLVVEAGTDRPIPFPRIRTLPGDHEGTGDDVGLFLLPGHPSGTTMFDISADGYEPQRVTLGISLGKSPEVLFTLTGAATATGSVIDAYNRQPVPGAIVKVNGYAAEHKTDDAGAFRIAKLPGITLQFEVSAPGYLSREFERPLSPTGQSSLRFLLRPELTTVEGVVVDSSNATVPSATVRVEGVEFPATTAGDGTFQLQGVRPGNVRLEASAEGYATTKLELAIPTADGKPVRINLGGSSTLTGRVVDAANKAPVKDVEIRVAAGRWKTRTDAAGRYELTDLPLGTQSVEVIGGGYRAVQSDIKLDLGKATADFELRGATVLSGIVTAALDGLPVAGADVQLEGVPTAAKTDAEGRFRFEDVVAGPARVAITAEYYEPAKVERETKVDEETRLRIELTGASRVKSRVVDAETGEPIVGAKVEIVGWKRTLTTDDKGEFLDPAWPPRKVDLQFSADGYLPAESTMELGVPASDENPGEYVKLHRPNSVAGIVVDARTETPVAGAQIVLPGRNKPVVTNAAGEFAITTPKADSYEFHVDASGYPNQSFVERAKADGDKSPFRLMLQKDSEKPVEPLPVAQDDTPPPSPAEQFGPSRPTARDPQEVEFFGIKSKAANVGFVVDCSGSMAGTRLERTKLELLRAVLDLHPKQMFYVAFFDDKPYLMLDSEKSPIIAKPVNKVRIYKWMKTVNGGGGTLPTPALEFETKMNPQAIYLLSDGVFDPLPQSLYDEFQQKSIRVNTIAFEDESGKDSLSLIAQKTQGRYRFVPPAPIPELYEVSLVTRLFEELLDQFLDPKTSTTDAADAHEGLVEFCNGQNFGPRGNATEAQKRHARDQWRRWWVENKLTPELASRDESRLKKNLGNRDSWWRWATLESLNQRGVQDGGLFVPKVRDPDSGIQQAARRALVRLAVDEDHGPAEGAGTEGVQQAFDKWTEWLRREKYIAGMKKRPDQSLAHDFDSPSPKLRRAAM
jgi:hypothetical protein